MRLLHPFMLLLLLLWVPVIWLWLRQRRKGLPSITISTTAPFAQAGVSWKRIADVAALVLRLAVVGALAVALARPQKTDALSDSTINGTDIVIALDVSESMLTPDMAPNRFEAARDIASDFASKRVNDNVALVAFAGESLTMMPLSNDLQAVVGAISHMQLGGLGDGTAIGDGLVTSVNRLLHGKAQSKSVILITDGSNNAGEIDPLTAAQVAKEKGVKVYTIAIGRDQVVSAGSYFDPMATMYLPIDVETLQKISDATGGKSYRATEAASLKSIFSDIDRLQKTVMETNRYTRTEERFMPWLFLALGCLIIELLIRCTVLRRIP